MSKKFTYFCIHHMNKSSLTIMPKYLTLLCFISVLMFSCKPETKDAAPATPTAAKTNTINTPIKVAKDVVPPAVQKQVNQIVGGAPLGSITNPIMNGLSNGQPPRQQINMGAGGNQPGVVAGGAPRKPEPPQNAKGVWHYICPDGHKGGSGKAEPCATCQKMLVHNQAYHQ